jgi:hypothetical protein
MGEGDGTVGLLSLGAMCVEGWKRPRWNPAGINVTTVEVSPAINSFESPFDRFGSFRTGLFYLYREVAQTLVTMSIS